MYSAISFVISCHFFSHFLLSFLTVISFVISSIIISVISYCHVFCHFLCHLSCHFFHHFFLSWFLYFFFHLFCHYIFTFGIYLLLELETFLYFLSSYHILKNIQKKPPIFLLITIKYDLILTALNLWLPMRYQRSILLFISYHVIPELFYYV